MRGVKPLQEALDIPRKVNTKKFVPGHQSKTGITGTDTSVSSQQNETSTSTGTTIKFLFDFSTEIIEANRIELYL